MRMRAFLSTALLIVLSPAMAAGEQDHAPPETLGEVAFDTSCSPQVEAAFNRAIALLHSFAYSASEAAFREVARNDPACAMAHWGVAVSLYHPLWAPPDAQALQKGREAIDAAKSDGSASSRERLFISAAEAFYRDSDRQPHADRARAYEEAMANLAARHPDDVEAQIFYALALLSTASPTDRTHAKQRQAARILEPLYRTRPNHPGLAHYLIHAYDSTALASKGIAPARAYSNIAPSAPHALHMPSHIFTRLGMWEDSVASNLAARAAAREQGDSGDELHAMDYLTYAYLQLGRTEAAKRVVEEAVGARSLPVADFKIGYAIHAMPVRLAIEQRDWPAAKRLEPRAGSSPHVAAIVYWARVVGYARSGEARSAAADLASIGACHAALEAAGDRYWAQQVSILEQEARAWIVYAEKDQDAGIARMRAAADEEDAIEKLPLTPGPIVPAREQLAEMLLESGNRADALQAFNEALAASPGRRGALLGAARARD